MSKLSDKLSAFIINNSDKIAEYESMSNAIPIEYCENDIIRAFQALCKVNRSVSFENVIKESIDNAIRQNVSISDSIDDIVCKYSTENSDNNITQQYFKEINDIYIKHKNNYNIEYVEENRDKLIEMNLKTVIMIAKKYQGLGLSLNELISAGNLGLVIAWDKFDPSRSKLKDDILSAISTLSDNKIEYNDLLQTIQDFLKYGDVKKKFHDYFHPHQSYNKKEIIKWINSNIYNAKFNSVATMWIRAYILIELDNNSRLVKKPKTEIYKDKNDFGSYKKENKIDIDAPINSESNSSLLDILRLEDDTLSNIEVTEAYNDLKQGLNILLHGVKVRDRGIFLKKFGIGLPRPLTPKEIAEQEGLSIARISQIFQTVIEQMQRNQVKYNVDQDILFDAVRKIY